MTPKNSTRPSRARRFASAAAVAAVLDGSSALAQQPSTGDVWAYYAELNPKGSFSFKMDGQSYTKSVGALRWEVPVDRLTAAGLDRNFTAFCAEPLVGVTAGNVYRFDVQMPDDPAAYGLPATDEGKAEAKVRATYIRELFGRHYLTSLNFQTPDTARAFQAALWELAFEKELPKADNANEPQFSLGTGTFQSDYPPPAEAPVFVATAEDMLRSLTGDDAVFYSTPGLAGRELVRMNGLPNAVGVVAQDQYALRTAPAAAGGVAGPLLGGTGVGGLGGGLGGGGGIGGPGFGGPVGGFAGGFGGIGGFGGGNGGSSSPPGSTINSPPTTPPTSVVPPPFSPPPINSPPPPPGGQSPPPPGSPPPPPDVPPPPVNGPPPPPEVPPPNPVPAPPGLLLGGIAALALAGRRALFRGKK